jgi:hypothetical protein
VDCPKAGEDSKPAYQTKIARATFTITRDATASIYASALSYRFDLPGSMSSPWECDRMIE